MKVNRKKNPESRYKRMRRIYFHRMFPVRQDALRVGFSVALGVFIGIMPTLGVAIVLTVAVCAALKLPKVPGVISSFVANPFTQFGFFYPVSYYLGSWIIEPAKIRGSFDFLSEMEGLSFKNFTTVISNLWHNAFDHLMAFLLGITIVSFVFAFAFFWIGYGVVSYRKKRHIESKNTFVRSLIQEDREIMKQALTQGKASMLHIYPFSALRPVNPEEASSISALPYDVMNREEAKKMAEGRPHSYLRVTRSELELPDDLSAYDSRVYAHARFNLDKMIAEGVIAHDQKKCLYVYRQTMEGREQYGLVCCVPAADYFNGTIKKHELTRADKEEDRLRHVIATNANTGPVFLTYRDEGQFELFSKVTKQPPVYDFISENDGFGHTVWVIENETDIAEICGSFEKIPVCYIADGHHRSAAGARAALYRAEENPHHHGDEEYNRYLAILFPSTQLKILDYNRVLKDLNGFTPESVLEEIRKVCEVEPLDRMQSPLEPNQVNLYLEGIWYACRFRKKFLNGLGPVESLDVSLLQTLVLAPIFGIEDPRTSSRIDFVGGIRGLQELKNRVDSGECAAAFAMFPPTMDQLMAIADADEIMPPKSTWFEPKLRDGLLVHSLD